MNKALLGMFCFSLVMICQIAADSTAHSENLAEVFIAELVNGKVNYRNLALADPVVLDKRVAIPVGEKMSNSKLRGKREWTPLTASIACGDFVAAAMLVAAGADVNLNRSEFGNSPLWMLVAATSEDPQVPRLLKLLIDLGADPNFATKHVIDGPFLQTPLHMAAIKRDIHVIEVLVEGGANLSAKDSFGHTPLDVFREGGRRDAGEMFDKIYKLLGGKPQIE